MDDKSEKDFYQKGFLGNQITEVTEAILKKHEPFFEKLLISPLKFPERLPWLSHAAFFV